jgi:predicted nucleic acid-binding protein
VGFAVTSGYLLDSNHVGHAVTPGSVVRKRVAELRAGGSRIGTCIPVLCEIEAGIQQVAHPEAYRLNLERLLRQVRIWPIDRVTAQHYGVIHQFLKHRGRVLSQVDMILAALCQQMNLTLVTSDQDFSALEEIPKENWIAKKT